MPRPSSLHGGEGAFRFGQDTVLVATGAAEEPARVLADQLAPALGAAPRIEAASSGAPAVELAIDPSLASLGAEGYRLSVTTARIDIRASTPAGLFYGTQSLRQLLPAEAFAKQRGTGDWQVPAVEIEDRPRFAWRGALLDPARNFLTIDELEDFIDLIALHKLNVLQIHLTDDQGWRIEIKKYPKLTEIGSHRTQTVIGWGDQHPPQFDGKPHGGFYSQAQLRALVEFARKRNVTILPEIEMPGHSQSAVASYPELGSTDTKPDVATVFGPQKNILDPSEKTIAFMQDVLVEVMDVFPSKYIHIGGDETIKDQWKANPRIQAQLHQLGLRDENALQAWFTTRMDKFLAEHGRRLIGWDEILEGGLSPNATVMSWRGEEGGVTAATADHDVVMSPGWPTYLDSCQTPDKAACKGEPIEQDNWVTVAQIIAYEPMPAALAAAKRSHVLGAQASIWGEFTPNYRSVNYQAWPRLAVFAEAVWSTGKRDPNEVVARLKVDIQRLDAAGVVRFKKADGALLADKPSTPQRPR